MELADERRFTIVDSSEMSTMAFLINEPEDNSTCSTIQKLDYVLQDSNNNFKKTFYIGNTTSNNDENYNVLLLTLGREKAYMNMAVLKKDELLISKEPSNVTYKTLKTDHNIEYKNVNYTPNFKRPISIVDPEIADEVKPVLYFDEEANMVKARVKLMPDKSYIALEVQKKGTDDFQTNYTICTFEQFSLGGVYMIKWGNYGLATTLEGGYVKIKSKGVEGPMLESKYLAHPVELMQVQEQEIEE